MTLLRSAIIAYQNGGKNAGNTNCGIEELICLASVMKEGRLKATQNAVSIK